MVVNPQSRRQRRHVSYSCFQALWHLRLAPDLVHAQSTLSSRATEPRASTSSRSAGRRYAGGHLKTRMRPLVSKRNADIQSKILTMLCRTLWLASCTPALREPWAPRTTEAEAEGGDVAAPCMSGWRRRAAAVAARADAGSRRWSVECRVSGVSSVEC